MQTSAQRVSIACYTQPTANSPQQPTQTTQNTQTLPLGVPELKGNPADDAQRVAAVIATSVVAASKQAAAVAVTPAKHLDLLRQQLDSPQHALERVELHSHQRLACHLGF